MKRSNEKTQLLIQGAGLKLKETREALQLTQAELADLLSFDSDTAVDAETVNCWEMDADTLPGWVPYHMEQLVKKNMNRNHNKGIISFLRYIKDRVPLGKLKRPD